MTTDIQSRENGMIKSNPYKWASFLLMAVSAVVIIYNIIVKTAASYEIILLAFIPFIIGLCMYCLKITLSWYSKQNN